MADIYDRARATAIRMLGVRANNGKGAPATLVVTVKAPYQPGGVGGGSTTLRYDTTGVRLNYKLQEQNDTVLAGDYRLLLSPVTVDGGGYPTPRTNDIIEFAGQRYRVVTCKPWDYVGLIIGHDVQVRNG